MTESVVHAGPAVSHELDWALTLIAFSILVVAARIAGECCARVKIPQVVGEILVGVALGKTLLGRLFPSLFGMLFPEAGARAVIFESQVDIALIVFMLVAGTEVSLSAMWQNRRVAVGVGFWGLTVPVVAGAGAAHLDDIAAQAGPRATSASFGLFCAAALSISALPVIIRTLKDFALLGSALGSVVVASAALNDVVGWLLMATVVAVSSGAGWGWWAPVSAIVYCALMLSVGRFVLKLAFDSIRKYSRGSEDGLSVFTVATGLCSAAVASAAGIHAVFGAFIAGAVLTSTKAVPASASRGLEHLASNLAGPLFFTSVALRVDFVGSLDGYLTLVIIGLACTSKIVACTVAARLAGASTRFSIATGIAMNARGAMEIILGQVALDKGLINEALFTSLVVTALFTSVIAGPLLGMVLGQDALRALRPLNESFAAPPPPR